ncbi:MAG: DNA alkylation repair protein [Crocinitomicaceae bacterium]|nr:DNA alkylation repair protein [Crocinitomicaceae bacterium]
MILTTIIEIFQAEANPALAIPMKAYMKNKFEYYGIKSPHRREISKSILKECKTLSRKETLNLAKKLYSQPQRELHYLALELLLQNFKNKLEKTDISWMEWFVINNSWWDTVDVVAPKLMAQYFKEFPQERNTKVEEWIASKNIWLIRSAILFQLKYKKETDLAFLFKLILLVSNTKEFFVNKAIGWILRENAKTHPLLITEFIETHQSKLSNLSVREGLKHIA